MTDDSTMATTTTGTYGANDGPCAGGVPKNERLIRRLRSVKDGRVKVTQKAVKTKAPFDPTAWYLYTVKRNKELATRNFLTRENTGFDVEAYVAAQVNIRRRPTDKDGKSRQERVVIHGKIFVRVDPAHRVDVMKKCPFITNCVTERLSALSPKDQKVPVTFVRVPDLQILRVRTVLDMADGLVEYTEHAPQAQDKIQVIGGQLIKGALFKDVQGEVLTTNGRKEAIVILDGVGCLKFRLPIEDIARLRK